ncbi:MAG: glycosyltransferase family 1 protein [Actinomycetota bacterium]
MRPRVAAVVESCWHRVPGGTATSTTRSLRAVRRRDEYDIVGLAAWHRRPPVLDELDGLSVTHLPLPRKALYELWHRWRRPRFTRQIGPVDVVHATGGVIPPRVAPLVVTIHDLAFLHRPEHFTPNGVRFMTRGFELARDEADRIIVPSQATADDCRAHGVEAERLRRIPWGAHSTTVTDAERDRVRRSFGLPDHFVLFVGTREPRKNLRALLDAHRSAAPELPLVIAGPGGWGDDPIDASAGAAVRVVGRVDDADLAVLYDLATALVYPSLLEGFGMPVLEAMAHGTAAVTSADTATAEVAGDTGVLIDPTDRDALGGALADIAADPSRWDALGNAAKDRAALFTWDATGEALAAVYDEVAA